MGAQPADVPAEAGIQTPVDHRVALAQRKRESMHMRILEATMNVFARINDDAPVIEDVVRTAGIARGTFYKHFDSLDQALVAAGAEANDRMIGDIMQLYDCLKEPWQRSSVGFRVYLVRALQDPKWAAFVTRIEAWSQESLITRYMQEDFRRGKELGQFDVEDIVAACDFFKGASSGGVYAISRGVADPDAYMDCAVRLAMRSLGCTPELCERSVAFSRKHLADWHSGALSAWTPL
jgi:AcrR family transcriptional regulator